MCSTVSNAAHRSRRMSSDGDPVSAVIIMLVVTLSEAVLVLWPGQKTYFHSTGN